jgi:hypothetical protein
MELVEEVKGKGRSATKRCMKSGKRSSNFELGCRGDDLGAVTFRSTGTDPNPNPACIFAVSSFHCPASTSSSRRCWDVACPKSEASSVCTLPYHVAVCTMHRCCPSLPLRLAQLSIPLESVEAPATSREKLQDEGQRDRTQGQVGGRPSLRVGRLQSTFDCPKLATIIRMSFAVESHQVDLLQETIGHDPC